MKLAQTERARSNPSQGPDPTTKTGRPGGDVSWSLQTFGLDAKSVLRGHCEKEGQARQQQFVGENGGTFSRMMVRP